MSCTIYKNLFDKKPHEITVDGALLRIKNGKSKVAIEQLRSQIDKERQDELKKNLPSVCFSGEFNERKDELIIKHSGFIVLDFDSLYDVSQRKSELSSSEFVYACWISPRNNGVKALVRIADGKKHREHFGALLEMFPDCDKSGVNEARVCFESYDPEIYINEKSSIFKKVKKSERIEEKKQVSDESLIFDNITKWLSNKGNAFISGERNIFIFKLASACCRFGLDEFSTKSMILQSFEVGTNKFSVLECENAIKSAYRANDKFFGTAQFDRDVLVDKTSRFEVEITDEMLDNNIRPKDVIFGEDVKEEVLHIFDYGYENVNGIGIPMFDERFKFKEGEITLLSGYGNYGKSSLLSWKLLMRLLLYGEKYAFFSPEENAEEFYHNLTEILIGGNCTPSNPNRVSKDEYEFAYDFISQNIFYVYPKMLMPTPVYIKERFLELIIKEKVKGVVIDPFNQLTNDYGAMGGRSDKYLESFLSDCARFSKQNSLFFTIVAHPVKSKKDAHGNYPCPDVFDIADGAMWNNKMDNIIIYDRPNHQIDPNSDVCELHSKKIRRQKIVGKKGVVSFNFDRIKRRYIFGGVDYMAKAITESQFYKAPKNLKFMNESFSVIQPNINFDNEPINSQEFKDLF